MKKILLLAAVGMLSLTSCDDFLDSANYTQANTDNFPASANDLNRELAALYGVMNQFSKSPLETPWFAWNVMSDDTNGAGGTNDIETHAIGHLMASNENMFQNAWHNTYVGIARANAVIYSVDAFDWRGKENVRNQLLGEAYFMRGLFYMWGTQLWGDIPAYWAAAAPDPCPQVSAAEVTYPHILADFVSAMNLMQHGATSRGDGHATKGAAEGMLARAYLYYQGFYLKAGEMATANPAPVELPEQEKTEGVVLNKQYVVDALADAINNGGYSLVPDFRQLWQYSNELTARDYPFVADLAAEGKYWAGNGNNEEMFQVQYGNMASWDGTIQMGFCNQVALYTGLRCDEDANGVSNGGMNTLPFGQGWGMGVFNSNSVTEWIAANGNNYDADKRLKATVLFCPRDNGQFSYAELPVFAYTTSCSEETGLYNKKVMSVTCNESTFDDMGSAYTWWGVYRQSYGDIADSDRKPNKNGNSMQGDHYQDCVLLRLSDVMLMHTELTGDATMMNKVRERAGLPNTSYTWQNLQNERRWELYGEGIRFNDLRRWSGIDGGTGCLAATALEKQNGSIVNYTGRWTTMKQNSSGWAQRYASTNGFVQIPLTALSIYDDPTILKQNAGWDSSSSDWNMTGTPIY